MNDNFLSSLLVESIVPFGDHFNHIVSLHLQGFLPDLGQTIDPSDSSPGLRPSTSHTDDSWTSDMSKVQS
jgi:hypothetical protein